MCSRRVSKSYHKSFELIAVEPYKKYVEYLCKNMFSINEQSLKSHNHINYMYILEDNILQMASYCVTLLPLKPEFKKIYKYNDVSNMYM